MFGRKKPKVLIWSVTISGLLLSTACSKEQQYSEISGETQGTTYTILLVGDGEKVDKQAIDSIFSRFDQALSTYIPSSVISQINNASDSIRIVDSTGFFKTCYELSEAIYQSSDGAFDPSVFPLIKAWGFMDNMETPPSEREIDSILQYVSFEKNRLHHIEFNGNEIIVKKSNSGFKLDFNAIAQGYSVDVVADFLRKKGYRNFYVEIGGEVVVEGTNRTGDPWRIGIDAPKEGMENRELENILHVSNVAIATSGNYRKFYEVDGVKYAHTLDPKTGKPVNHSLLSATVLAESAAVADAYATAFMVLGDTASLRFVEVHPELNLEVYLLYADSHGEIKRLMSDNFSRFFEK